MCESLQTRLFGQVITVVLSMLSGSRGPSTNRLGSSSIALIIPIVILLPSAIVTTLISFPYVNAVTDNDTNVVVEIDAKSPFRGADGEIKLMGVVQNTGDIPLEIKLGVYVTTKTDNAAETTVIEEAIPYSRILYPYSVSPFKFSIKSTDPESQTTLTGIRKPFIINFEKLSTPNYDGLVTLNYTNIPSGDNAPSL